MDQNYTDVELEMAQAEEMVTAQQKLAKLRSNREFRSLILEGYLEKEAIRLTKLLGDSTQAKHREEIQLELTAIGKFDEYLRMIDIIGRQAAESLREYREDQAASMSEAVA